VGKALHELFHENITKNTDNQIGEGNIDLLSPKEMQETGRTTGVSMTYSTCRPGLTAVLKQSTDFLYAYLNNLSRRLY
jgi:hypothetical protein